MTSSKDLDIVLDKARAAKRAIAEAEGLKRAALDARNKARTVAASANATAVNEETAKAVAARAEDKAKEADEVAAKARDEARTVVRANDVALDLTERIISVVVHAEELVTALTASLTTVLTGAEAIAKASTEVGVVATVDALADSLEEDINRARSLAKNPANDLVYIKQIAEEVSAYLPEDEVDYLDIIGDAVECLTNTKKMIGNIKIKEVVKKLHLAEELDVYIAKYLVTARAVSRARAKAKGLAEAFIVAEVKEDLVEIFSEPKPVSYQQQGLPGFDV